MAQLTKDFPKKEMQCPCCGECSMSERFMYELQRMRDYFNTPLSVNSGFRCAKHNKSLRNSSPTSRHLYGQAADIKWPQQVPKWEILDYAMAYFDGVGIAKSYIHIDHSGIKKVWVY